MKGYTTDPVHPKGNDIATKKSRNANICFRVIISTCLHQPPATAKRPPSPMTLGHQQLLNRVLNRIVQMDLILVVCSDISAVKTYPV
jgi:hypothetical protein